jgi:hypothetical protein
MHLKVTGGQQCPFMQYQFIETLFSPIGHYIVKTDTFECTLRGIGSNLILNKEVKSEGTPNENW